MVKLNNGAAMARPTDTDTESAKRQREGVREKRREEGGERTQASSKCNAVPCRAAQFLAPGIGQKW